jgi:hypothetical protein
MVILTQNSMKQNFLQRGDVFSLKAGMEVYTAVPQRFVYSNTPYSNEITKTNVRVGETLTRASDKKLTHKNVVNQILELIHDNTDFSGITVDADILKSAVQLPKFDKQQFDTSEYIGDYVVVSTALTGGGTGHGPHDVYPDGWYVTAKKLKGEKYDSKGKEISFYQSGCFSVTNKDVHVVRKMQESFK